MRSAGFGLTDVGRRRDHNEDSMYLDDGLGLYVVSDGMGGHAGGEVASATAVESVRRYVERHRAEIEKVPGGLGDGEVLAVMANGAIQRACLDVYRKATSEAGHAGMGCTLTMLLVAGSKAAMGHVGDSRLYLLRQGIVSQVSTDHTMATDLAMLGMIHPDEIRAHHYAHVLSRAVGTHEGVQVDTLVMDVLPGDVFLACSDGLCDHITDDAWIGERLAAGSPEVVASELISYANDSGGHDNVTVVVVTISADEPEADSVGELSVAVHHKFDALSSVFLFDALSLPLLTRVLNCCEVRDYHRGEVIINEGELCDKLLVITEGRCEARRCGRGDLGMLEPGDHVGATALLNPRPAKATLTAAEDCRLLSLSSEEFWSLVKRRPWLGVGLLERLARRLGRDLDSSIEKRDDGDPATSALTPLEAL